MLIEEIPSNWKQRWIFRSLLPDLCLRQWRIWVFHSLHFYGKNAQKPLRWDMLKCTICFQKCATRSLERGDSLACVCEERFLRKGRGKSYFTFKSYCQDRTNPKCMSFIFYGRPVAIWFAGDFLQCSPPSPPLPSPSSPPLPSLPPLVWKQSSMEYGRLSFVPLLTSKEKPTCSPQSKGIFLTLDVLFAFVHVLISATRTSHLKSERSGLADTYLISKLLKL